MPQENSNKNEILKLVQQHKISAQEGTKLLLSITPKKNTAAALELDKDKKDSEEGTLFYKYQWIETVPEPSAKTENSNVRMLIFDDRVPNDSVRGGAVFVKKAAEYKQLSRNSFEIRPDSEEDYIKLFETIENQGGIPDKIIHNWSNSTFKSKIPAIKKQAAESVYSLFNISRYLSAKPTPGKIKLIYFFDSEKDGSQPLYEAVSGFARTVKVEHPDFFIKSVELCTCGKKVTVERMLELAAAEFENGDAEVRYQDGKRYKKSLAECSAGNRGGAVPCLRDGGVYIITGGAGNLGFKSALYIAGKVRARFVFCGRSAVNADILEKLKRIGENGSSAVYVQGNIADESDTEKLIAKAQAEFGAVNGIIHCAGVAKDSFIIKKNQNDFTAVLEPKILGAVNLFNALFKKYRQNIDLFVTYSSVAAVFGNIGQCDYAFANSFLDNFMRMRSLDGTACRYLSVNWPYWENGGFSQPPEIISQVRQKTGVCPISDEKGIDALDTVLKMNEPQIVVLNGETGRIKNVVESLVNGRLYKQNQQNQKTAEPAAKTELVTGGSEELYSFTEKYMKNIFSKVTKIPGKSIKTTESFEKYGLDSIIAVNLNEILEEDFGELSKTLFFEHQSLKEVIDFFMENHKEKLIELYNAGKLDENRPLKAPEQKLNMAGSGLTKTRFIVKPQNAESPESRPKAKSNDIAIIGLNGTFPKAKNLHEFWKNLCAGMDCITEIPESRWDYHKIIGENGGKWGSIYSKWGGFVDDVDKFDPIFFHINPIDATLMDPQERLFLQSSWNCMEDAGYTRSGLGTDKVGVFAGVWFGEYQMLNVVINGKRYAHTSSHASIANRVSYCMNFHGPSFAVDTMCSSSITAIHVACESIIKGESDLAIAGGVNVSGIHPDKYIFLSQGRFLSADGKCRAFGEGGSGYVPGEGVGTVLLKPLEKAVSDGDHIYAVIKASAINHGGKTSGYSVPNPAAQAQTISEAITMSGVNARDIGYLETHGTGTALGDTIEMTGLKNAFGKFTQDKQFCAIGSVKSNIGHLESAAGIAGLAKVLLQLKYEKLVPSIHAETLNPNINFEDTQFYVNRELSEWKRCYEEINGKMVRKARTAGLSAFGAGGSNAHIILQEYIDNRKKGTDSKKDGYLIVLSAKNRDRLDEKIRDLYDYVININDYEHDIFENGEYEFLERFSYTLQVGREPFEERLAFVVKDFDGLVNTLGALCGSKTPAAELFRGNTEDEGALDGDDAKTTELAEVALTSGNLRKSAQMWVSGAAVNWILLYGSDKPVRLSLPAYPFAKERYWAMDKPFEFGVSEMSGKPENADNAEFAFYVPEFAEQQAGIEKVNINGQSSVLLIFAPQNAEYAGIAEKISKAGDFTGTVATVSCGDGFMAKPDGSYIINPRNRPDYDKLIENICEKGIENFYIIHLWGTEITALDFSQENIAGEINETLEMGLYSVLYTFQSITAASSVKKTRMLFAYNDNNSNGAPYFEQLASFAKSIPIVNRNFDLICAQLDNAALKPQNAADLLKNELFCAENKNAAEIRYSDGKRQLRRIVKKQPEEKSKNAKSAVIRSGGVYLIVGGTGGVGAVFARILARKYKASIILTGKSELNPKKRGILKELESLGGKAVYHKADISKIEDMRETVLFIKSEFGALNGVIHSAGIADKNSVTEATRETFQKVLQTKVDGLLNLDLATKDINIDFFIMFSSTSSEMGDMGNCSYAVANGFMDRYAVLRQKMCAENKRSGLTVAVDWPLWDVKGIDLPDDAKKFVEYSGTRLMNPDTGEKVVEHALSCGFAQIIGIEGNQRKISEMLGIKGAQKKAIPEFLQEQETDSVDPGSGGRLLEAAEDYLKNMLSGIINLPKERISSKAELENYGIDSVIIMDMNSILSKDFGALPQTLFFEYKSIRELAAYFVSEHAEKLRAILKISDEESTAETEAATQNKAYPQIITGGKTDGTKKNESVSGDIAIIGMDGKYPLAENLDAYWQNLKNGRDCVTEFPAERRELWDAYDPDRSKLGKTYSKWGGFLKDIDAFDPMFFNITPKEASGIDPQERMFLECAYHTVEDSGYSRQSLWNSKTGVFVGVMYGQYQLVQADLNGSNIAHTSVYASIANRISYFFNFTGPSMAVDTMCSSSLTAIHLACRSILNGECEMALAGGVNLQPCSDKYQFLCQNKFLSSDGRCRSFGDGGDGYVPSEGVGAILLKPLKKAEMDDDRIYAVIKGTAINHGGKSNGYTVPSPVAQKNVIEEALKKANVDAKTISSIEAHGTGTSLGDPVEIDGLTKVFGKSSGQEKFCSIGSVKSNIGHAEAAAGIAAVTKVVLEMRHRQLVPSIHSEKLNPNIDFDGTPFFVQRKLADWENTGAAPRRAGISSFGAGGANAHVILQEYKKGKNKYFDTVNQDYPVILSAGNEERIRGLASQLLDYLKISKCGTCRYGEKGWQPARLADISFTLCVGREEHPQRLAFVVSQVSQLEEKLEEFLAGKKDIPNLYAGNIKKNNNAAVLIADNDNGEYTKPLMLQKKYRQACYFWTLGLKVDWELIFADKNGNRYPYGKPEVISLPGYLFAKERCWLPSSGVRAGFAVNGIRALHPLIDINESTFEKQCFRKTLTEKDFFMRDHVVMGKMMLPGVAYIEMARAAASLSYNKSRVAKIKNIVWAKPVVIEDKKEDVYISLYPSQDFFEFEISTVENGKSVLHSCGSFVYGDDDSVPDAEFVDIEKAKAGCTFKSGEEIYDNFSKGGYQFGPAMKSIKNIYGSFDTVVSEIELPEVLGGETGAFVLHPSLMDGSLQSLMGLETDSDIDPDRGIFLPYSIDEVEIVKPLEKKCYAFFTKSGRQSGGLLSFNIKLTDLSGEVLVRVKNYTVRTLEKTKSKEKQKTVRYFKPLWQQSAAAPIAVYDETVRGILLFDCDKNIYTALSDKFQEAKITLVLPGPSFKRTENGIYEINPGSQADYNALFRDLAQNGVYPENIIHMWSGRESDDTALSTQLEVGVYSIYYMSKALLTEKINSTVRIMYVYFEGEKNSGCAYAAVDGFGRSVRKENPRLRYKVLKIEESADKARTQEILRVLLCELNLQYAGDVNVKYENSARYVKKFVPVQAVKDKVSAKPFLRHDGVYLITGGMGKIGFALAEHIAHKTGAALVLTGRSVLSPELQAKIEKLEAYGGKAEYIQCDISNKSEVGELIKGIIARYGGVSGVMHCAGILRDSFLVKKTKGEMDAVFAPKVYGTSCLCDCLKNSGIEFFAMWSSITGAAGNIGQCDYAYANSFMDNMAEKIMSELPGCKPVSFNWPLLLGGGMKANVEMTEMMEKELGVTGLDVEDIMQAFEDGLNIDANQIVVLKCNTDSGNLIKKLFETDNRTDIPTPAAQNQDGGFERGRLLELTEKYLKEVMSDETKIPQESIDVTESFDVFGIDSITAMDLIKRFENEFGELSKTLLFEYHSISELAMYFIDHCKDKLVKKFGMAPRQESDVPQMAEPELKLQEMSGTSMKKRFFEPIKEQKAENVQPRKPRGIAIIGMDGRFPMADNMDEYWEIIKTGKNCITEIPGDRWNYRKYYSKEKNIAGKTYSKWGGFINDVDKFDPLFFNISPREAEIVDPQERIFLQSAWKAVEDSGYTRKQLSEITAGVFVGVWLGEYQMINAASENKRIAHASSFASIANRVSYCMNLCGPSLAVDTICSSSLTAVHLACESILNGESDIAIAGGVNVSGIHPDKYLMLSQYNFASSDGECHSFGAGGDGYVPGEGVGAFVLKPLEKAEADGDHIYAVIRSTAINHGGKSNGYSVPNPTAQANLILNAIKKSDINPRAISYVEAHGTGTALGDPIEIKGLSDAFSEYTNDRQYCAIGSVKANIGHLESASGAASLCKVLLQLKNKKLAPSINSDEQNPYIDFTQTQFYVQHILSEWKRPVLDLDGVKKEYPRIAGISSFGAAGSNAHIIVEEYDAKPLDDVNGETRQIIILSAKNKDRLLEYAQNLREFIEKGIKRTDIPQKHEISEKYSSAIHEKEVKLISFACGILSLHADEISVEDKFEDCGFEAVELAKFARMINDEFNVDFTCVVLNEFNTIRSIAEHIVKPDSEVQISRDNSDVLPPLMNIAYTLQVGREQMDERMAVIAGSPKELFDLLGKFINGESGDDIFTGNAKTTALNAKMLTDGDDGAEFIRNIIKQKKYRKLCELWVAGADIGWDAIFKAERIQKVSLPTYPFAKERCWLPMEKSVDEQVSGTERRRPHPLLEENTSTLNNICFSTSFSGDSPYESNQTNALVLGAYFEMMRAAGVIAGEGEVSALLDIKCAGILPASGAAQPVKTSLLKDGAATLCEISLTRETRLIYAKSKIVFRTGNEKVPVGNIDIERLKSLAGNGIAGADVYQTLANAGSQPCEKFKVIKMLYNGGSFCLAQLDLPRGMQKSDAFSLHPLIIEGGLQTAAYLAAIDGSDAILNKPFSVKKTLIFGKINDGCFVYSAKDEQNGFDLWFIDESGKVLAVIKGFAPELNTIRQNPETAEARALEILKMLKLGKLDINQAKRDLGV